MIFWDVGFLHVFSLVYWLFSLPLFGQFRNEEATSYRKLSGCLRLRTESPGQFYWSSGNRTLLNIVWKKKVLEKKYGFFFPNPKQGQCVPGKEHLKSLAYPQQKHRELSALRSMLTKRRVCPMAREYELKNFIGFLCHLIWHWLPTFSIRSLKLVPVEWNMRIEQLLA